MNTLNLTLINEQAAYEVWQTSQGDFNFETLRLPLLIFAELDI